MTLRGPVVGIDRAFCFIRVDSTDYFAHRDDMIGVRPEELASGELLDFEPVPDAPRGPRAMQIRRAA